MTLGTGITVCTDPTPGTGGTLGDGRGAVGSPGRPPIAWRTCSVTEFIAELASGGIVAVGAMLVAGRTPPPAAGAAAGACADPVPAVVVAPAAFGGMADFP